MEYNPTPEDVAYVRDKLGWTVAKDDSIRDDLKAAYSFVVDHTRNDFGGVKPDGSIDVPESIRYFMAKFIELGSVNSSLKSRSMGTVSYTYQTEIPAVLMSLLRPYKRIRFRALR